MIVKPACPPSTTTNASRNRPRISLYQPDIPGNTGTLLRLGACLGIAVDVIKPTGFHLSDKNLKRSGMDYLDRAAMNVHDDWESFEHWRKSGQRRLILLSTKADTSYVDFRFQPSDCLLFGRESSGVPDSVVAASDACLTVPMAEAGRSLNVAISAAIVLGEALRQTGGFGPQFRPQAG